jgi:hypothetical protein
LPNHHLLKSQSEHMPFCRKCGRRLPQYSESCPDCKTSTTAPIINTKRAQVNRLFHAEGPAKIAQVIFRKESPIKKVITAKPVASPKVAVQATRKAAVSVKIPSSASVVSSAKAAASSKPFISAKHIVKPKRVAPTKPIAPFSIAFARPVTTPNIGPRKPVTSFKPVTRDIPAAAAASTFQPKPAASATPAAPPKFASQPNRVATQAKPVLPPKPITPAPVYPSHEIIKSKVSLKEDITANPHDYERQPFAFDLQCPNGHFWPAGKPLVVSNGKAFCLQCGELLRKPKRKRRNRNRKFN